MPFDSTPPTLPLSKRLAILYELLPKSSPNQGDWSQCLWSEARKDERVLACGLSGKYKPVASDLALFGPGAWYYFEPHRKEKKAQILRLGIAEAAANEKRERERALVTAE